MIALFIVVWIICGFLAYGITLACFQRSRTLTAKDYFYTDSSFAVLMALNGPVGLLVSFFLSGFARHGLMYRNPYKD